MCSDQLIPFLILVVLFSVQYVQSQELCTKPWQYGRFELLQTESNNFGESINRDKEWIKSTEEIFRFSEFVSENILNNSNAIGCDKQTSLGSAQNKILQFNMGRKEDLKDCRYTRDWSPSEAKDEEKLASKLFDSLDVFDQKLTGNSISEAIQNYIGVNKTAWGKNLYSVSRFYYDGEDRYRSCYAFGFMMYRSNNIWYIDARVTNSESSVEEQVDYERYYAGELISFNENARVNSKLLFLNESCDLDGNLIDRKEGTLFQSRWKGKPSLNGLKYEAISSSEALQKAVRKGDFFTELVMDARLPSSAAILLVPAILAFFPLSLFQEVSVGASIFYSAATDFISVIPIFVKGVELYRFGNKKNWGLVSGLLGDPEPSEIAILQTNVAFCSMKSFVSIQGIIYMCIGISLMILGILLEVVAWKYLKGLKEKWINNSEIYTEQKPKEGAGIIWYWKFFQDEEKK